MSGDVIFSNVWNSLFKLKKKTRMYDNNTHIHRNMGCSQTDKWRWRFLTLHLNEKKTCCPLKCNFLKQDTWTKLCCVFSSSARLLLLELCESPGQAFRSHFGKHEHPVYFSRIRRGERGAGGGGGGGIGGGGGGVFVCPCEREGGGGEEAEEGWIDRKEGGMLEGKEEDGTAMWELGGVAVGEKHINS